MTIARVATAGSVLVTMCALGAGGIAPSAGAGAGAAGPATRPAAPANTWVDARLRFILPEGIPGARWETTDGYSGATYRSRTGTVLWRTGVKSKAAGLSPGYYSNATLEWAPATGEARVVDVLTSWGGGSYGGGRLLAGFEEHPMPPPRHVYDAFDYVAGQDAVYLVLGSYWKVGLSRSTPEAKRMVDRDKQFTWKYAFADRRWHRIDHGLGSIYKNVTPHGAALQPWPQAGEDRCTAALLLDVDPVGMDVTDPESCADAVRWWMELTAGGGEGMVVKPHDFVVRGRRGLAQPAVKCRGREYLRIIYGPEYTFPEHLGRLRQRALGAKRSLAVREFALGVEALERFVRREPLRRVHECVFGILALESEPVDPRL